MNASLCKSRIESSYFRVLECLEVNRMMISRKMHKLNLRKMFLLIIPSNSLSLRDMKI